jgi:hypothetical protein
MPSWTVDRPRTIELEGVAAMRVRVVGGSVAILAAEDAPSVDVASLTGQPLLVTQEAGILTITYEDLRWDGMLEWLRPQRHTADLMITLPRACPMQVTTVSASATVSGMAAKLAARTVSGGLTLDGLAGSVDAKTVSGDLEARDLEGSVGFNSVSGALTLAGGSVGDLSAKTVSGRVTADIDLRDGGGVRVTTVSGEVAIRLPACASARVSLRSASGRVHSGFDALTTSQTVGMTTIAGTLGTGLASITAASVTGDVTLLARPDSPGPGQPGEGAGPGGSAEAARPAEPGGPAEPPGGAGPADGAGDAR